MSLKNLKFLHLIASQRTPPIFDFVFFIFFINSGKMYFNLIYRPLAYGVQKILFYSINLELEIKIPQMSLN